MKTQNWAAVGEMLKQSLEESFKSQKQDETLSSVNEVGEYVALGTIIKALVASMALDHERSGRGQAQEFVNNLAETCAKAIDRAHRESGTERMKLVLVRAREKINNLLAGVVLPKIQGGN
jgi:hypothetical protein